MCHSVWRIQAGVERIAIHKKEEEEQQLCRTEIEIVAIAKEKSTRTWIGGQSRLALHVWTSQLNLVKLVTQFDVALVVTYFEQ